MAEENQQLTKQQLQPEAPTSNKRIAKNALMLYIRMFISMLVGLYTSRIVLSTLGVEDYGIYAVVGGVVAMMGFLNASMSGATSRFLTFELGRGDQKRLSETFSTALIVHIGIAIIVFVLAETVGLWFLCNKLVIPEGRMDAAHWVYQCSIFSAMLGITQVPYNASIISHEKMDIYAYVEILNVILKLAIVFLLVIGSFDKLKLYALLMLSVSIIILTIYRVYCIRRFQESHFKWIWNKNILKPLLSFSMQTIAAHGSYSIREQGTGFALNFVFGVIVNAASGIATTINGIISHFSSTIFTAFNPQIIKSYALGNFQSCNRLITSASIYSTLLILLFLIPFEFEAKEIIQLWLGQVPDYSVAFIRVMLLSLLTTCITQPVYIGLTATGDIKKYSYIQALIYLLCPFIIYVVISLFKLPVLAYVIILIAQIFLCIILLLTYKRKVRQFDLINYFRLIFVRIILPALVSVVFCFLVRYLYIGGYTKLVVITFLNGIILAVLSYLFLSNKEKQIMRNYLNKIREKV